MRDSSAVPRPLNDTAFLRDLVPPEGWRTIFSKAEQRVDRPESSLRGSFRCASTIVWLFCGLNPGEDRGAYGFVAAVYRHCFRHVALTLHYQQRWAMTFAVFGFGAVLFAQLIVQSLVEGAGLSVDDSRVQFCGGEEYFGIGFLQPGEAGTLD